MATDAGTQPSPPPPPGDHHHRPRRLVRYSDRGPLGGVCAGIARYLGVNVTLVRIGGIVLACMGVGIPAYIVAWLVIPDADGRPVVPLDRAASSGNDRVWQVVGICIIVVALSAVFGDWWWPGRGWMVPIALIAVGAWLLFRNDDEDDVPVPPTPPAPPTTGGGSPTWAPSDPTATSVAPAPPAPPAGATEVGQDATDDDTVVGPPSDGGDGPPTDQLPPIEEPPPAPKARRRRVLGPLVFGGLLVWGGIAWIAGVDIEDGLAVGLCILGAGFVLGAFIGGSKILVLPALLIAAALVMVSVIDIPLHGGIGDRRWQVDRLSELDDKYELAIGEATLDLSELDVPDGRVPEIEMNVGVGHLEVILPDGATVVAKAEAGAGEVRVLGYSDEGMGVELARTIRGDAGGDRFVLDLHVGLGKIEVYEGSGSGLRSPFPPKPTFP